MKPVARFIVPIGKRALSITLSGCLTILTASAQLTRPAWAQGVQSTSLPTPSVVAVKVNPAQKATTAQITRYLEKTRLLEEHDIPVQTRAVPIPFSSRLSANKLTTIKPRAQALFSDGINVKDQVDATKLAGMDYHYVSTVAEPSVAVAGEKILITFNWGAVWSTDKGKTFQQLDPYALFDQPQSVVGKGFCCDQLALYDKTHDLVVWLLQGSDAGAGNTIRLLFAKGADLTPGQSLQWHVYESPESTVFTMLNTNPNREPTLAVTSTSTV
jgi:hypothetical protein